MCIRDRLKDAGIGTYILFQETYHKESYEKLHPTGPKHDYCCHTEAMDRAQQGGIDDVGCGVLFGLELYRYEFAGLLMHAEHLEAVFGVGPHTISVPRIRRADEDVYKRQGKNHEKQNAFSGSSPGIIHGRLWPDRMQRTGKGDRGKDRGGR